MTPPADPRTVLRALVEAIDGFAEHRDSSAQTCLGFALEDARPALAVIEGKVWLDVDVAKMLVKAARETMELCDAIDRHHVEPENNRSAGAYADKIDAALAAAEAELAKVEARR